MLEHWSNGFLPKFHSLRTGKASFTASWGGTYQIQFSPCLILVILFLFSDWPWLYLGFPWLLNHFMMHVLRSNYRVDVNVCLLFVNSPPPNYRLLLCIYISLLDFTSTLGISVLSVMIKITSLFHNDEYFSIFKKVFL